MNSRRTIMLMRWTVSLCALAGIVLLFHRWLHVNATTVALTLLLFVLVLASEFGLRYAIVVAVLASACYNYYFLAPIGTFTVADPQNWLALAAFLVTAVLASRLSNRARDEAAEARRRQRELEILLQLSKQLLQTESVNGLLNSAPSTVASVLSAPSAAVFLLDGSRWFYAGMESVSTIEAPHYENLATKLNSPVQEAEELLVPLRTGVKPRGLLVIRGATLTLGAAEAVGGLISVTIDRAQALENVARGEAAKESERLRNLMIDSITHELRTPLTAIKGAVSTLLTIPVDDQSKVELLTVVEEEADRLNHLVGEALEMAQLDAQQVHMEFSSVRVAEMVEQARSASPWVEEKHALITRIPQDVMVRGDEHFLQKVLTNLIENAAKYSAPGTNITITAERNADKVSISVADQGSGIDLSEQSLIFERFYRGRGHAEHTGGTGMGLAISRAIMEAHGGSIDLRSQVGRGSVFTLTLDAAFDA